MTVGFCQEGRLVVNENVMSVTYAPGGVTARETLDNPANPRDNDSVIARHGWVHGRQAAWIR
jgi:hypothetical protein